MRKPDFVIMKEKMNLFLKSAKPITDWNMVEKGTLILHKSANCIEAVDKYICTKGDKVKYMTLEKQVFSLNKSGWYFYDEKLVDEITYEYTSKIYNYKNKLIVAFNVEEAFNRAKEIFKLKTKSFEDFSKEVQLITMIDGYKYELTKANQ